jgi:hypothetical protein
MAYIYNSKNSPLSSWRTHQKGGGLWCSLLVRAFVDELASFGVVCSAGQAKCWNERNACLTGHCCEGESKRVPQQRRGTRNKAGHGHSLDRITIHTPASRRVRKAMGAGQAELLQGLEIDLARRPAGSEKIGAPGGMDKIYCSSWPNMIAAALQ